ncbi:MAG: DUF4215 domain-containing protein, partial [Myxococcales bacterium]|nr:DUF4215 domain-containing protein [Myxococcales bacterium]
MTNLIIASVYGDTVRIVVEAPEMLESYTVLGVWLDGCDFVGKIRTSCGEPIYAGQTFGGNFKVVDLGGVHTGDPACGSEPYCGDGALDGGEECDDGNSASGDGCSADCLTEFCGDGVVQPGEECDDGNDVDGDGCSAHCVVEYCGDGVKQPGEECDDGNDVDG